MPGARAAVIGAGTMGAEIAQVLAEHEVPVVLKDVSQDVLDRALRHIERIFRRRVDRGRLSSEEAQARLALVHPTVRYDDLGDADIVIEAVPERFALKAAVFSELDRVCKPEAILATNTSSLSVSRLAMATGRPSKVLGFHFFNPASVMKLVEVIVTPFTSDETAETMLAFGRQIGKLPVRVKECPGFLVNRILFAGIAEGMRYQHENDATIASVDAALRERAGFPMGPFQLADLVGLDVVAEISAILVEAYGERFALPAIVRQLVEEGQLGAKSGGGFYRQDGLPIDLGTQPADPDQVVQQVMAASFLEAYRCLNERVARADDIDLAMQAGAGWSQGPLAWAEQLGLSAVSALLGTLATKLGARFAPPEHLIALAERGGSLREEPAPEKTN
ncbi:MAG: 3-hydroxyacyl-CoA dehydrogenase [Dehalococcoidia bacterium]|nr:3-hydroxyacyl-CoA dehydrogenase [Dehalococcoidia bacterium]